MMLVAKRHLTFGGRKYRPGEQFDCKLRALAAAFIKARSAEEYIEPKVEASAPAPTRDMAPAVSVPTRRRAATAPAPPWEAPDSPSPATAQPGEYARRDLRAEE